MIKRILNATELRMVTDEGQPPKITMRAAPYNSPSEVLTDSKGNQFREVLRPGAFRQILSTSPDVRLLINHEGVPLGRTRSGTLRLTEDAGGLLAEADLDPSNPDAQSLISAMKRGDIDQCSFAFNCGPGDAHYRSENGMMFRDIHNVSDLSDVSVVTYPAYRATSAELRAEPQDDPDLAAAIESEKQKDAPAPEPTVPLDVLQMKADLLLV